MKKARFVGGVLSLLPLKLLKFAAEYQYSIKFQAQCLSFERLNKLETLHFGLLFGLIILEFQKLVYLT